MDGRRMVGGRWQKWPHLSCRPTCTALCSLAGAVVMRARRVSGLITFPSGGSTVETVRPQITRHLSPVYRYLADLRIVLLYNMHDGSAFAGLASCQCSWAARQTSQASGGLSLL